MFIYLMRSGKCFLSEQDKVSIVRLAGRSVNKVYQERPHKLSIWDEDKRIISQTIFTSAIQDLICCFFLYLFSPLFCFYFPGCPGQVYLWQVHLPDQFLLFPTPKN